jgi:hypothetical protein
MVLAQAMSGSLVVLAQRTRPEVYRQQSLSITWGRCCQTPRNGEIAADFPRTNRGETKHQQERAEQGICGAPQQYSE